MEKDKLELVRSDEDRTDKPEVYEVVRPGDTLRVRDAYGQVVVIRGRYSTGWTRLAMFMLGLGLGLLVAALSW